jgi:predicted ATPase
MRSIHAAGKAAGVLANPWDEVLLGWWRLSADGWAGLERAAALLEHAINRNDPELMMQAHHCSWASNGHIGAFDRCIGHAKAGLAIYHQGDYRHHARLYGNHDAKVCAHGNLCQMYWIQGKLAAAKREETQCLAWGDKIDHLGSRIHAMGLPCSTASIAVITGRYSIGRPSSLH